MTDIKINRLGLRGDGIADGPIYVPRSLPGEVVTGILEGQTLREPKILVPSDDRVAAPCRHFKSCGGCQLQHASDGFVAEWKVDVVRQALASQGLKTDFRPIATSPPHSRRRAGFAARRTKKGALVGFYGRGSDVIVPIPECRLLDPDVLAAQAICEALAVQGASRKTPLSVLVTASDTGLDLAVQDGKPLDGPLRQTLAQMADEHKLARLTWNAETIALRAQPLQSFDGLAVVPPPGSFLQATRHGETALREAVLEIIGSAGAVVDLFAGCGTFSLPVLRTADVHAVEGKAEMLRTLDHAWRHAANTKKLTTETRDLFRRPLLPDEFRKSDAVIIDPPRAGAEAQVAQLAGAAVPVIAYVSCNPVTFARDTAKLVQSGYVLEWVQVVDQFRWSAHVELAACLRLSHMR